MSDIYLSASTGMTVNARAYLNNVPYGSDIPMTEIGTTGEYYCDMQMGSPQGKYLIVFFNGTTKLSSGLMQWDGSKEVVATPTDPKLDELHKIHGLQAGSPLVVTQSSRSAGNISQTLASSATDTIVSRL